MLTLFLQASLIIAILVTLLWLISIKLTNASIVDIFWGFGFVVVNAFYFFRLEERNIRNLLLLVLVTLWGLRLTLFIAWRNWGKGEDFRYRGFRKSYGPQHYWWVSFFQVFLLQGGLILIVSLPLLGAHHGENNGSLGIFDFLGIGFWIVGFVFETGGDLQLARFKNKPDNQGKVLDTGFWKYTRHPNYFGDAAVWWGFAFISLAAGSYWHIAGSVVMTLLLVKVSGVAMLEKTLKNTKPHYRDYIEKTNAFIPWFPRKTKP